MQSITVRYQTVVSTYTQLAPVWERMLKENLQRYKLRVELFDASLGPTVIGPGGSQKITTPLFQTNIPRESKWTEDVSQTTGEWYSQGPAGTVFVITEVIQLP